MSDRDKSISGMETMRDTGFAIQDASLGDLPTMQLDQKGIGRVDRYELLEKLGEGGFGAVYGAKDSEAGILVALKALPAEVSCDVEEMTSIRDNFALVSRLHHPHIASVLHLHKVETPDSRAAQAMGIKRGDYLVVMEYAPGATLFAWRRALPDQKMDFFQALEICRPIADALDYAHSQKVLHRDVKPKNVMISMTKLETGNSKLETNSNNEYLITNNCQVKILDFGLAAEIRSSMSRKSKELKQSTSGTPNYMAPEQWRGTVQNAATDQYALAVMIYELLSGTVPFKPAFDTGNFQIMLNAVCNNPIEPLPELTKQQNAVLQRALAKEPQERFASCRELVEALAGGKSFSPRKNAKSAKNKSATETKSSWAPRMRGNEVAIKNRQSAMVAGLLVVGLVGAGFWFTKSAIGHRQSAMEQARVAQMNQEKQQQLAGLLREAEALFAKSDFDGAGRKASEVLALDAANSAAGDLLAKIQSKVGEQQASVAKVDAKLARERNATVADCKLKQEMERQWQIGETAWGRERWQDAWKAYQETIRLAGVVQQMPEYFAVQKRWNLATKEHKETQKEIEQYAAVEWAAAEKAARLGEAAASEPVIGKQHYENALVKYAEAVKTAEPFLVPQVTWIATLNGKEVPATLKLGSQTFTLPTTLKLKKDQSYTSDLSYAGCKSVSETLIADWTGLKEMRVVLEEWNSSSTPELKLDSEKTFRIHRVQKGETISSIATSYGMSWKTLTAYNNLSDTWLVVGQELRIPSSAGEPTPVFKRAPSAPASKNSSSSIKQGTTYTIQKGDSIPTIAKRSGLTISEIKAANGMRSDSIIAGKKLIIPRKGECLDVAASPAPARVATPASTPAPIQDTDVVVPDPNRVSEERSRVPFASAPVCEHVLYPGETLKDVARQYGCTQQDIMKINNITDPDSVKPGTKLLVPIPE